MVHAYFIAVTLTEVRNLSSGVHGYGSQFHNRNPYQRGWTSRIVPPHVAIICTELEKNTGRSDFSYSSSLSESKFM